MLNASAFFFIFIFNTELYFVFVVFYFNRRVKAAGQRSFKGTSFRLLGSWLQLTLAPPSGPRYKRQQGGGN